MARRIDIQSDSIRSAIIAGVMISVLAGSLALAYALTVAHREPWAIDYDHDLPARLVQFDDLHLMVPLQFEQAHTANPFTGLSATAVFVDGSAPSRRMLAASVRGSVPRAPKEVLNETVNTLLTNETLQKLQPWQPAESFRVNEMRGAWFAGVHPAEQGEQVHLMTVLTGDGRQYWLIYLSHLVENPRLVVEAIKSDRRLLAMILGSVENKGLRPARGSDFEALGLGSADPGNPDASPEWLPADLEARISPDHAGQEPLLLFPNDALAAVHLLRIRGVTDLSLGQDDDPLSPTALLTARFEDTFGRPPKGDELWAGKYDHTPVWRVTLSARGASMARRLWYARLGHGRALLIEALCEPQMLPRMARRIAPLIAAARAGLEASPERSISVEHATSRGRLIARLQTESLPNPLHRDWRYYLILEDGRVTGCQVQVADLAIESDPLPLMGVSQVVRNVGTRQVKAQQKWRSDREGSRFWLSTQWATHDIKAGTDSFYAEQMKLHDGWLTNTRTSPSPEEQLWSVRLPDAFILPMAEETWPNDPALWNDGPALVWMTDGRSPPEPHWIKNTTQRGNTPQRKTGDPEITMRLLVRKAMSLDADEISLDDQGQVVRYRTASLDGPGRGTTLDIRKITRDELIKTFPTLESLPDQPLSTPQLQETPQG